MNRDTLLARTPLVKLVRFDHPVGVPHRDPAEELSRTFSISFVERGTYDLIFGRRRQRFAPGIVFVTRPGLSYRCRHDREIPDDTCLSVVYSGEQADEAWDAARLPVTVFPTSRLAYNYHRLLAAAPPPARDPLDLETRAAELLDAVSQALDGRPARLYRAPQITWYARRIDAARERLETRYAEPQTLVSLAREAGMSPFHFARLFRELAGIPPHRYLMQVRLLQAARRLRQGVRVTDACFDTGFGNLSHFIRTFRRAFGVSPTRYRA